MRAAVACAILLATCAGRAGAQDGGMAAGKRLVVDAVVQEVAANEYWSRYAGVARDSTQIHERPSTVVPGLVYLRGYFVPPRSADVGPFRAAAAVRGGSARVLRSAADWGAVARWSPRDGTAAATACAELVDMVMVGPGFGSEFGVVYRDSAELRRQAVTHDNLRRIARSARHPSALRRSDGLWEATLWWVTQRRTVRKVCTFRTRGAVTVASPDSIPHGLAEFLF